MFSYRWNGMWQEDMKNKEKRIHPNQKPVALYEWILANYAKRDTRFLTRILAAAAIELRLTGQALTSGAAKWIHTITGCRKNASGKNV